MDIPIAGLLNCKAGTEKCWMPKASAFLCICLFYNKSVGLWYCNHKAFSCKKAKVACAAFMKSIVYSER